MLWPCPLSDACAFDLISDYKMPFVPSDKEYEVVFIREGERVVIPCRGSVENLNVTLHTVRNCCFCVLVTSVEYCASLKVNFCRMKSQYSK